MKSLSRTFVCICLLILISGCATQIQYDMFKESAAKCVAINENEIIELYNKCKDNKINSIVCIDEIEKKDGIIIDYNNKQYLFVFSDDTEIDVSSQAYMQACEIVDNLNNGYTVDGIFHNMYNNYIIIYFEEAYLNVDWGIAYYSPDATQPEDIYQKEQYEEIKDGFYTYLMHIGF